MSDPEFLKKQVELNREKEKCPHCGGDIRDMLLSPWEREGLRKVIRGDKKDD